MQRHHGDRISRGIERVGPGDEHRLLQETIERRETHFAVVIRECLRGAAHEFAHVLDAIEPFLTLGAQQLDVADARDQCLQYLVHRGLGRHRAQCGEVGGKVCERCACRRAQAFEHYRCAGRLQQRNARRGCLCRQQFNGRVAQATSRHADRAAERLVIGGIRNQLQVRHQVANLATVVEAHGADQAVWPAALAHRIFEGAALRVGAIKNCDLLQVHGATCAAIGDVLGDVLRLVTLVEAAHASRAHATRARRAQRLAATFLVRRDRRVGECQDLRRGAIVFLEPHHGGRGELALEVQDVANVGATPAVDRLIVVTHHHHVALAAGEQRNQLVLRLVGVLVLVDEDEREAVPIAFEQCCIFLQQLYRQRQQVVEPDRILCAQRVVVERIQLRHHLRQRIARESCVFGGRDERVLRIGNLAEHGFRRPFLRRDAQPLHQALDHAERVILVVDRELRRAADTIGIAPQQPRADGVKGADPHALRRAADEAPDAVAHLAGRLVGERDREDLVRRNILRLDQACDARREHARLARPCASQHEQRPVRVHDRGILVAVQAGQR